MLETFWAACHCRPPTFTPRHHSVCDEVQTRGRLFEMILTSSPPRIPIPKTHMFIHMFLGGRSTEKSLQLKVMIIILKKGILMMDIYTLEVQVDYFLNGFSLKTIVLVRVYFINNCRGLCGFNGLDFQGKYKPLLLG